MNSKEIQALLLKYRQGKCTEEEIVRIHLWYDSLNGESVAALDTAERDMIGERMLGNLLNEVREPEPVVSLSPWWRWNQVAVYMTAAALFIAIGYWAMLGKKPVQQRINNEKMYVEAPVGRLITEENTSALPKKVVLEDNSVVTLDPGSAIIYPKSFAADKRAVQLIGDAFFEITKNPDKPFFVYSGKLITRVLGTSFRIKTRSKDKALEVEVVTGKVSVFENQRAFEEAEVPEEQNNGVVLTPNQRVTYFSESRHLMTGLVPEPVKAVKESIQPKLVFNDSKLEDIIHTLHQQYGIEIVFANDRLSQCTFTGDITEMPLYEKLDLICKSNGADYEVKGTRILINGKGCD
jgi:ferric-dicitrate binding protein FerR (iron transport regulator)